MLGAQSFLLRSASLHVSVFFMSGGVYRVGPFGRRHGISSPAPSACSLPPQSQQVLREFAFQPPPCGGSALLVSGMGGANVK